MSCPFTGISTHYIIGLTHKLSTYWHHYPLYYRVATWVVHLLALVPVILQGCHISCPYTGISTHYIIGLPHKLSTYWLQYPLYHRVATWVVHLLAQVFIKLQGSHISCPYTGISTHYIIGLPHELSIYWHQYPFYYRVSTWVVHLLASVPNIL